MLVLPSIVWISLDRSIWPWDPAWYGQVTVELWAKLRLDPGGWPEAMAAAFGAKPPAIAWLGQVFIPFGRSIGNQEIAMLLSVIICQAATVALVFSACRRLRLGQIASLAAALLVASSPLFVSMSHEYFAEPIQTLAIAWCLFVLASAVTWPLALTTAQLPGILALAMLSKLSSPVYLAAPVAGVVVLALTGRRSRDQGREWRLTPTVVASALASALLVVGAVAWYRVNLHAAVEHARAAGSDSGLYGHNLGFIRELPAWLGRFEDAVFLPYLGVAVLAIGALAVADGARRKGRPRLLDSRTVVLGTSVLTVLVVLALFALQPNEEGRYLLGLVPLLAATVAIVVSASPSRAPAVAVLVVLAAQFALVTMLSFGVRPFAAISYFRLVAPVRDGSFSSELDRIVDATCTSSTANRISMVGAEHPWFNANTMTFIAAQRFALSGRNCYYTSLGYAETKPGRAWKRVVGFSPPFYISIDYGNPANRLPVPFRAQAAGADAFNRVNRALEARVRASGSFRIVPGSRTGGFVVFENERAP